MLESLAARRPCVTTEVGCCRELLEGAPATPSARQGYCVPPDVSSRDWPMPWSVSVPAARPAEEMGEIGRKRVERYYRHEQMLANYRALYADATKTYHLTETR